MKVWPRARGLDSGLPHAAARGQALKSFQATTEPTGARRKRSPRRGAADSRARTPHLRAGPAASRLARLRPCRPHSPYARLVPPENRPRSPLTALKPRPPPRTKLEAKQHAATRHHHDGVCSSPAAPCVSNLWNSGTTSPRMPCRTAGPRAGSRGKCSSFAPRFRSSGMMDSVWF